MTSNKEPRLEVHSITFARTVDTSVSPTRVLAKQRLFLSDAKLSAGLTLFTTDVVVSRFFDAVSRDRDVEITSTANDNET